jgi:dihydrofolate reductase
MPIRRVRYSIAASLDGFIADPSGGYDWIIMDPAIDFAAAFRESDTFVMGRKTFEVTTTGDFMGMLGNKEVIVFSRTLKSAPYPNVTIVSTSPAETVRALKQKSGQDIWLFGGGDLFRQLVDAALVDTIEVGVMPVLLSQGIPMLPAGKQVRGLTLTSSETLSSGILMLTYSIPHD